LRQTTRKRTRRIRRRQIGGADGQDPEEEFELALTLSKIHYDEHEVPRQRQIDDLIQARLLQHQYNEEENERRQKRRRLSDDHLEAQLPQSRYNGENQPRPKRRATEEPLSPRYSSGTDYLDGRGSSSSQRPRLRARCASISDNALARAESGCRRGDIELQIVETLTTGASAGDCQFDAIAMGLCRPGVDFQRVRNDVAGALEDNHVPNMGYNLEGIAPAMYPGVSRNGTLVGRNLRRALAAEIRAPGVFWGDYTTLAIAAWVYNLTFLIFDYTEDGRGRKAYVCRPRQPVLAEGLHPERAIILFFRPEVHYTLGVVVHNGYVYPHLSFDNPTHVHIYHTLLGWR